MDSHYIYIMKIAQLQVRPWMLKKEIMILGYAFADKRTPLLAKIPALFSVIYLLSPIDLIPDFIPFFGYVDDLLIVPLLLNLSIRLLPMTVKNDSIIKAMRDKKKIQFWMALIVVFVVLLLAGVFFLVRYLLTK